jgi:hypothetical protein
VLESQKKDASKGDEKYLLKLSEQQVQYAYNKIRTTKSVDVVKNMQLLARCQNWMEQSRCPLCSVSVVGTRITDKKSWKEFCISGMCQECQNKMFYDDD